MSKRPIRELKQPMTLLETSIGLETRRRDGGASKRSSPEVTSSAERKTRANTRTNLH
jgi:hypothetical protein